MTEKHVRRPLVVTLAVVLVTVSGLLSVGLGILILLSRYRVAESDVLTVSLVGAGTILFGLLTLAVAGGIRRGSRLSRLLVTLYAVLELVLHVVTIVTSDTWDASSALDILLGLALLVVVWAPPGSRYFVSREPAPDPMAV
ncbi:hypothetical protein [Microbacterium sp. SORGH_AS_0888]|uniref:hypothetical protein n=1 Tax=Microbacterium sp. SORGH_AS_0888 TaxID=3041791 RepID=UPI0027D8EF6E|nr:hypothetical protein [Microbacterium sp. SORGH_AS_0888]